MHERNGLRSGVGRRSQLVRGGSVDGGRAAPSTTSSGRRIRKSVVATWRPTVQTALRARYSTKRPARKVLLDAAARLAREPRRSDAQATADRHRRRRRAARRRLPRRPHRDPDVPRGGGADRPLTDATARQPARIAGALASDLSMTRRASTNLLAGSPGPRCSSRTHVHNEQLKGGPMHRPMTPTALRGCAALLGVAALCCDDRARARPRRHRDRLERLRVDRDRRQRRAAAARLGAELRDGARRRLRRGERDRSRPPPLPHRAAGRPLGLKGRRGGDSGVPRPRSPSSRPSSQRSSRSTTRRSPPSRTRHPARRRPGSPLGEAAAAAMLAARADDGRFGPFTPVVGTTPGRLAPHAAALRPRPRTLGRKRTTVPGPRRRDAPHRRAERPDQPRLRAETSTRSRRSARCTARPERRTRPTPRSSGKTTPSASGTACSAPSPPPGT